MLKNRIQYFILLFLIVGLYIYTNQYFTAILLLFFLLLPAFSFALLMLSYKSISADFEIPPVITKAKEAAANFTLSSLSFFPVSGAVLHISCRNNLTGKEIKMKTFCPIESKKVNNTSFAISNISAGRISVSLNKIEVCDIFGLFSLSKRVLQEESGFVYPDTYEVEVVMENQAEINMDGERYSQTKTGQDVNEIFALREYIPGDEIRKIHWKLSAKQSKLVVRDFGLPLNYSIFLLLEVFDDKKKNSGESLEACMMTLVSVSSALAEKGICHNIAWYDSANEKLIVKEIGSLDGLQTCLPELLSVQSYNKDAIALKFFEAGKYCNTGSTLYYITTKVDKADLAERALYQTVKAIYVTDEDKDKDSDSMNDSFVVTVTPRNIRADIESITI